MCGCPACCWPLAFHDRQATAFSWAMPISTTRPACGCGVLDQRPGSLLLVLSLDEAAHRNAVLLRELVHRSRIGIADLPERCRRRNPEPTLPAQELADQPHGLKLGHVGLKKDPVHRAA